MRISLYLGSLRVGGLVLANCNANRRGLKELAGYLACLLRACAVPQPRGEGAAESRASHPSRAAGRRIWPRPLHSSTPSRQSPPKLANPSPGLLPVPLDLRQKIFDKFYNTN